MNAEHWRRIREVLEPALELPADQVTAWLDQQCPAELRAEVDALIDASNQENSFVDEPVLRSDAPLEQGTEIGPYVVDELIGVGGMGVVYRAHDPRLDRLVAIKLLTYGGRVRDSIAEARSASALDDRNIVVIHDVLVYRDAPAIVMEYVEGDTLADLIEDKPLPPERVRRTARRIAAALSASHEAGILHRDLKPGNVIVRPDGTVKVLDFGIARRLPESELLEARAAGTAGYMAPEQADGRPLDARADIYAFGAVVRDMLLGRREAARRGDAATALLPKAWRPLIERCLAESPDDRFGSMREVEAAVRAIGPGRPLAWVAGVAAMITVGALIATAPWSPDAAPTPPSSFETVALPGTEANRAFPTISPDGSMVVFSAPVDGNLHLFVQRTGSVRAIPLGIEGRHATFSPDGRRLAYRAEADGGGVFVAELGEGLDDFLGTSGVPGVPVTGPLIAATKKIADAGFHPAWSPDGAEIVFSSEGFERAEERATSSSRLIAVELATGATRPITDNRMIVDAIEPAWSPDGTRIAFWSVDAGVRRVWTVSAQGGTPAAVTDGSSLDWGPAWSPDGWLYWSSDRSGSMNAWRARLDTAGGRPVGPAQAVPLPTSYAADLSFAGGTGEMVFAAQSRRSSIWTAALDGDEPPRQLTPRALRVAYPSVSPDGEWLVAFEEAPEDRLLVMRTDGSELRYVTQGGFRDRGPAWSPDGETIAFVSSREGDYEIWSVRPDGTDLRLLVHGDDGAFAPVWDPQGARLAWFARGYLPMVLDLESGTSRHLPPPDRSGFRPTSWSTDGARIAGLRRATDGSRLGASVLDLGTGRYEDFGAYCQWLRWMPGGRRILCAEGRFLLMVDTENGDSTPAATMPHSINNQFDVSPDGERVYASLEEIQSEVWVARPVAGR